MGKTNRTKFPNSTVHHLPSTLGKKEGPSHSFLSHSPAASLSPSLLLLHEIHLTWPEIQSIASTIISLLPHSQELLDSPSHLFPLITVPSPLLSIARRPPSIAGDLTPHPPYHLHLNQTQPKGFTFHSSSSSFAAVDGGFSSSFPSLPYSFLLLSQSSFIITSRAPSTLTTPELIVNQPSSLIVITSIITDVTLPSSSSRIPLTEVVIFILTGASSQAADQASGFTPTSRTRMEGSLIRVSAVIEKGSPYSTIEASESSLLLTVARINTKERRSRRGSVRHPRGRSRSQRSWVEPKEPRYEGILSSFYVRMPP